MTTLRFHERLFPTDLLFKNFFETDNYVLKFDSNNISIEKEEKINAIKFASFESILKKTLNEKNFKKIEKDININFINSFILNMTIENEKIINNNYFSEIKINFNKNKLINYFINKKINFVENYPNKFLLVIFDENNIEEYNLSKKNSYYKFLKNIKNKKISNFFLIPNLDFNDRYLLNKKFNDNNLNNFISLNNKYKTNYQILLHSIKINNSYNISVYLIEKNNIYFLFEKKKF